MKRHPLLIGVSLLVAVFFYGAHPVQAWWGEAKWKIQIDAAAKSGPSRIKNFMSIQGSPLLATDEQGSNEASRQFEIAAWKALNLTTEVPLIDGEPGQPSQGITVMRAPILDSSQLPNLIGPLGPKKDLYLDTSPFDAMQDYYRDTFGSNKGFNRTFGLSYMPKTLSSNPSAANYFTYPPANYTEWRAVIEASVRYLNKRGIDDPHLTLFGEVSETVFNVLGSDGEPYPSLIEPGLREYVRLYAESQRAVKAADPGAKVWAMCAGIWGSDFQREIQQDPKQKGLDEFIAYVAEYNAALPPNAKRAELDNICWQGYSWQDEKRMVPMVEHIQAVLKRHRFDPATPQYLAGWSGGWVRSNSYGDYPLNLYAPHLVYNVIEQLNPGGAPGPIAQADYYTWNLDKTYDHGDENSSLIRTVHGRTDYDESFGHAASDQNCLRPAYVSFRALKAMEQGDVLTMKETRPLLARSIATVNSAGIHVLLVNYTDKPQQAQLTIQRLPETVRIKEAVLRRVPEKEVCSKGNWFSAGDPMAVFSNEPAGLTADKSGTVTTSVTLAANTVALFDIPIKK